jgi:hypothetical protein
MKSGVLSGKWGFGGLFHGGIGGRSAAEWAAAASGKLSTMGGRSGMRSGLVSHLLILILFLAWASKILAQPQGNQVVDSQQGR